MRVLMLTHNMAGIGGSYQRSWSLARGLAGRGVQVTLLASRRRPGWRRVEEVVGGVRVVQMADWLPERVRHGGLSPLDLAGRLDYVRSTRFDLIHGFDHRPAVSLPALHARRRWGTPYVADWADLWGAGGIAERRRSVTGRLIGRLDEYAESRIHAAADAATVITGLLESRVQQLGIPPDRVCRVEVGANPGLIEPRPKAEMRFKYGLPEEGKILVLAGFAPYDREFLVESIRIVASAAPEVILLLTGGESSPSARALRSGSVSVQYREFGIVPYDHLGEILACGDIMLLPLGQSLLNAARFPNRFGDYLAAGRPIATTRVGELAKIIERERIGVVSDTEPGAFAEAVVRLLRDRQSCEAQGRRARGLAETRYSWEAIAGPAFELYRSLVEAPLPEPSA
jgi:glycosyltransferase involved in cell wall biosynthesis